MMASNYVVPNRMLERAVKALSEMRRRPVGELPGELRKIAERGVPAELQFNEYRIKYLVKEKGEFNLHWYVVNGVSGASAKFYTKDFQGNRGGVYWRKLGKAIRI